jgi:alkyl sulfatase BDS1-like metallo-beta-lactamase superfamily hydrolase
VINIRFSDLDQNFVLQVRNSVLYYREAATDPKADASLTLTKSMFLGLVGGQVSVLDMIKSDALKVDGSVLRLITFFSLLGASNDSFNIVTP